MYNVRTWSTTSTHGSILMMSQGGKGIWRKNPILHARPSSSAAWNHKKRDEMKLNVLLHHFFLLLRFLYFCDLSIIRWKLWIMDFGDNLVQSKGRCHELSHVVNINGFLSWDTRFISFSQYEKSIFPSRLIRWILFLWRFYLPFLSCLFFCWPWA